MDLKVTKGNIDGRTRERISGQTINETCILFAGRLLHDCFLKEIQIITSNSNISHGLLLLILLFSIILLIIKCNFLQATQNDEQNG